MGKLEDLWFLKVGGLLKILIVEAFKKIKVHF